MNSNIPINVWYYNELTNNWILKSTSDYQETKDELKYFRVLSNSKKYFYNSSKDYIKHNKNNIIFDYDINTNENTDNNNNNNNNKNYYVTDINNNRIQLI